MANPEPADSNLKKQSSEATIIATNLHESNSPAASSSSESAGLSPVARIFRGDIGRILIIVLMPLTMAFMTTNDAPLSLPMRKFVFCSLTVGLTTVLHGIWPENNAPTRHAMLMDQIGAGFLLIAFSGIIMSFLPDSMKWIPLASVLMLLFVCFY